MAIIKHVYQERAITDALSMIFPRLLQRYNPSSPQPPPMMAPDDQQGTGTLSAAARRASMGLIGRNDWQDKGGSGRVGISGGGRPSEVHKRPRSPQPSGKGLHSACPRSSPNRHKDLRNQDSRGTGEIIEQSFEVTVEEERSSGLANK